MKKYKINMSHLESKGGCERLERDGFSKCDIHRAMFKLTDGADKRYQEKIIDNLYHQDRHANK